LDRSTAPVSRRRRRWLPDSIAMRLMLTGALLAVITTAATVGIDTWLVSTQVDAWTRGDMAVSLKGFHSLLDLEAADVRTSVDQLAMVPDFRRLVATSDRAGLAVSYDRVVRSDLLGYATAVLDASGTVLSSSANAADVRTLRSLVTTKMSGETTGLIVLGGKTAIVYGQPITSMSDPGVVGYLITARLFDNSPAGRFGSMTNPTSITLRPPGFRPKAAVLSTVTLDGVTFSSGVASGTAIAVQDLPAIGGGSAGVVELRNSDPRAIRITEIAVSSGLLSAIVAIFIGIGVGAWLTGVIRRPVLRMSEHLRTQGYLAAEGIGYTADDIADDMSLPAEFRDLGAVMQELLRHLNARHSELKNAISEAEYAQDTMGVVVNESTEAKMVLQDGKIIAANPAAASALGLPVSQLTDLTALEALNGVEVRGEDGTRYDADALVEAALTEHTIVSITEPGRIEHWYVVDAVRHEDGLHHRMLLTARDITEERRLALIRAEIVSIIGHDLRSPLTVVIGYLDLLTRPMPEEQRLKAVETARRNAGRMADLLEDLLTATKAEELLAPSELVPTALAELAEEVVGSMAPTHAERALLLEVECEPVVLGEEKRLRQVLVNLVTNAYKYSPETDPVLVRVRCDLDEALLEVVDHGPGIPADDRDLVFERFARLANTAGRPGLGLGLYIVSIIAHNHGGSAHVEETPGGGATFVVRLPLAGLVVDGKLRLNDQAHTEG
jgi:signal transduction histidine kinase